MNKKLLKLQKESFEHDLEIMNKEVRMLMEKINNKEIIVEEDEEIFKFYVDKLSTFMQSREQVIKFIKEIENKLKEGDNDDNKPDEK